MAEPDDRADALLRMLRQLTVELVRRDGPDLSVRQLAIFLLCYLEDEAQTVRGLAKELNVPKAAVSRGLDRLMEFNLIRRKGDPRDRRSIFVQRTPNGRSLLRELRGIATNASTKVHRRLPAQTAGLMSSGGPNRYTVFTSGRCGGARDEAGQRGRDPRDIIRQG